MVEKGANSLREGQVLCANKILSLDPYMRSQIADRHLTAGIRVGDLMRGETVSEVVQSKSDQWQVGDRVRTFGGWQEYAVIDESALVGVPTEIEPQSYALSVLGMPGLTAYAGINWLTSVQEHETVVIPAATGAVGSTAVQLCVLKGCRVIGIAGTKEKCSFAIEQLGVIDCINRREEDLDSRLKELAPNGVDFYFDLVGGETLNSICNQLAVGARIVLCGLMSEYNSANRSSGPMPGLIIKARAKMLGLVVYDFESRRTEFLSDCIPLVNQGKLSMRETSVQGLEQAPHLFNQLMAGNTSGKALVYL